MSSVVHDSFTIQRTYPAAPETVFAAWAGTAAKTQWFAAEEGVEPVGEHTLDFRPGGRERFTVEGGGSVFRYDALYYDIVPGQRIVYSYEMYQDGTRISVSLATIEFRKSGDGTAMTWTEQGTYLDGVDGADASALRRDGTAGMLEGLTAYLARTPAAGG